MRLKIDLIPLSTIEYSQINRYIIQGFIYNILRFSDEFKDLHVGKRYKFFNFSNFFPISDFREGETKSIIVSSPRKKLIKFLHRILKDIKIVKLGIYEFKVKRLKKFKIPLRKVWRTSTPIVLYYKTNPKEFFSFKRHSMGSFIELLTKNSLTKYKSFYNEDIQINDLFEFYEYEKEVALSFRIKNKGYALFIGTMWKKLGIIRPLSSKEKKFYKFLMDTGLGVLNSLGFGFINPIEDL